MSEELVHVFTTPSVLEGHLAKGRLEAEEIPVLLKGEGEGPYRMGPVHLFVPERFEVQARLVLESLGDVERADRRDASEADERSSQPETSE